MVLSEVVRIEIRRLVAKVDSFDSLLCDESANILILNSQKQIAVDRLTDFLKDFII